MTTISDECMSCGDCIERCPHGAIEIKRIGCGRAYGKASINKSICNECEACLDFECPAEAIGLK